MKFETGKDKTFVSRNGLGEKLLGLIAVTLIDCLVTVLRCSADIIQSDCHYTGAEEAVRACLEASNPNNRAIKPQQARTKREQEKTTDPDKEE